MTSAASQGRETRRRDLPKLMATATGGVALSMVVIGSDLAARVPIRRSASFTFGRIPLPPDVSDRLRWSFRIASAVARPPALAFGAALLVPVPPPRLVFRS